MSKKLRSHQIPENAPEYVEAWAKDLIAVIGKQQARAILEDYKAISENSRLAKADREIAKERAEALEGLL